jgi:hypothetical protein
MDYFTVRVIYAERIPDHETWYNLFADLYGMKTTCYDGYVRDITCIDEKTLELSCYLVDDPKKLADWKYSYGPRWIAEQREAIRRTVLNHSVGIQTVTILEISPSLSLHDTSPCASSCDQVA